MFGKLIKITENREKDPEENLRALGKNGPRETKQESL